jgi:hypothetical protein
MTEEQTVTTEEEQTEGPVEGPARSFDQNMLNEVNLGFFGKTVFQNASIGVQNTKGTLASSLSTSTGLVGDADISAALERFVQPEGFAGSTTLLARDRMVVLCGRPGMGKRSSALSLLREVTDETLYMLSPNISLSELAGYEYKSGCGYLVVDRVVDTGLQESDFEWRIVHDRVVGRTSYLVVTQPVALADGSESFGHVDWQPPSTEKLLRAYWQQEWSTEDSNALAEALASVENVRDVVGLARQLNSGKSLEDALQHLDTRVRAEVEKWFDGMHERRSIVEITTLAFTTGVDLRTFDAAVLRLLRAMHRYVPEPAAEDGETKEDHLPRLRESWLRNELVGLETLNTELGARRVLKFSKPEQHRHVLTQLWQRMDVAFWDAVSDWLDEIVVRPRYELSVAVGLAEFASVALDEVMPILDRWAQGFRQAAGQRSTVYTLYLMAYDESLAPIALRIATNWITRGKPTHRWVGAMAFIGQLGVRYPHDARRRLWQVCVQSHTVDGNVEQVFGELFANLVRNTENAHLVLNFLTEKVDRFICQPDAKPGMRTVTARTALAVIESRDANTKRSSVLAHLADFPEHTALVARLLSGALIHRPVRLRAIKALRALLEDLAKHDENASEHARALGEALRAKLPPAEHDPLEEDFRIVAARKKDTDIRSLVDAVLNALKGRVA